VYWANYNQGSVYTFRHRKNGEQKLSGKDIKGIAGDLDDTFNKAQIPITRRPPISESDIEDVTVITWYNMYATVNTRTLLVKKYDLYVGLYRYWDYYF